MAQAEPSGGELRHVEWDGWGFVGTDTTEYLVYDPTDGLKDFAGKDPAGKVPGIPCVVPLVRRMVRGWYVVRFYTDQAWGVCYQPS